MAYTSFMASFPVFTLLLFFLIRTNLAQEVIGTGNTAVSCLDPPGTSPDEFDAAGAGNLLSDILAATGAPANWFIGSFIFDNFGFAVASAAGCADLSGNSGGCALPVGPFGTVCELVNQTLFDSVSQTSVVETPETVVLVGKSYINGYAFLKNMNQAASDAAADIKSSGFLDKLANDLVPDTSAELIGLIALDLIEIGLGFVPVADLGALTKVVKFAVKGLKKVIKSEKKSDKADLNSLPSASDLSTQLDGMLSGFQQGLSDQHADIFVNAEDIDQSNPQNSDTFQFVAGGAFLGIDLNQDDMKRSVEQGMKNYLVPSVLNSTGCEIFHETAPLKDGCGGSGVRLSGDGSCDTLAYTCNGFSGPNGAADFQTNPNNIYGTLTLANILDNAIACAAAGGSISSVDIDSFLENENSIPDCFFGFPVHNSAPPLPQDRLAPITSNSKGPRIDKRGIGKPFEA